MFSKFGREPREPKPTVNINALVERYQVIANKIANFTDPMTDEFHYYTGAAGRVTDLTDRLLQDVNNSKLWNRFSEFRQNIETALGNIASIESVIITQFREPETIQKQALEFTGLQHETNFRGGTYTMYSMMTRHLKSLQSPHYDDDEAIKQLVAFRILASIRVDKGLLSSIMKDIATGAITDKKNLGTALNKIMTGCEAMGKAARDVSEPYWEEVGRRVDERKRKNQEYRRQHQNKPPPFEQEFHAKKTPSYFDVLGVADTANDDEIKKAYHKQVRAVHPDLNPNDSEATNKTKTVIEAYAVLKDPETRERYLRGLK